MRIFHGLYNVAGIPTVMARAERAIGIDSRSVCFPSNAYGYEPDITEAPVGHPMEIMARFHRYVTQFDVFVFHFGHSLTGEGLADVPLLKKMGKSVIFYFHGCDIRQSKETIRKYEHSACAVCWPPQCSMNRDKARATALEHADEIWVSTPDLIEFIPGAKLFLQPIELDTLSFREMAPSAEARRLRLVHAPSDNRLKGTELLLGALEGIESDHPAVELVLLQDLSHSQVLNELKNADVAVDQLLIGSYGMFAVESMATGVPVICYLREDLLALYPERPPMYVAQPGSVGRTIRDVVCDAEGRTDMSAAARRFVEDHHSSRVAAARAAEVYRQAWTGRSSCADKVAG